MLNSTVSAPRVAPLPALLVLAGLLAVYIPSFIDLFHGAWSSDRNAHGPIVMVVAMVFLYFRLSQLMAQDLLQRAPQPLAGALVLVVGLLSYVLGRSQNVLVLEVGSLIWVLSGLVIAGFGVRTWRRLWFAFFFMLFMIPMPASVVDVLTLPMKIAVSAATEHLLYWAGYPIARSGVILTIGQYQLLVADACAGLNSLFTLEALGLLYMNLVRHPSLVRNVVLASLIVPISFTANTIRIVFLSLITYHLGDAAGQGFLHSFSGLVLFLSALLLIIGVDSALSWLVARRGAGRDPEQSALSLPSVPAGTWQRLFNVPLAPAVAVLAGMLVSIAAAHALTPHMTSAPPALALDKAVPAQIGEWKLVPDSVAQATLATNDEGGALTDQIYDEVVTRTYINPQGTQMMLALAYAREQRQDVKLHLPEICYPAQGYKVVTLAPAMLAVGHSGAAVPGKHMLAEGNGRTEAVTYWTRVGDAYPNSGMGQRLKIFRDGLHGVVTDGILVRASVIVRDAAEAPVAYQQQESFLRTLVDTVQPGSHPLVAAAPQAHQ
ncbi:exosortase B [Duganella dendranthematis]|nr:exosortase B [Duganella dendranthematis]